MSADKKELTQAELAAALLIWFRTIPRNGNEWRSPVGKVIKQELDKSNNWRNAPRGNPRKGLRVARERKARREGWIEEE